MKIARRKFVALLGGAAAAWPLAARAQQPELQMIGYLSQGTPGERVSYLPPFLKGLSEMGYVEGRNVAIAFRYAQNDVSRLPELAADLVHRRVALIASNGGNAPRVVKSLTTSIPIVSPPPWTRSHSVLCRPSNRPGSNITGIHSLSGELELKQLGLMHDLLPRATRFGILWPRVAQT